MPQPVDLDADNLAALSDDELAGLDDDAFDAHVEAYIAVRARAVERAALALLNAASKRGAPCASRVSATQRHGWRVAVAAISRGVVHRDAAARGDDSKPRPRSVTRLRRRHDLEGGRERARRRAPSCLRRCSATLSPAGRTIPVEQLARAVERAKLAHGKDKPPKPSEATSAAAPRAYGVDADLDVEDGEVLDVAIHAAMERLKLPKDMPIAQRRAIALVSIGRYFLEHVDDPAMTRVGRPHLIVVADVETLAGAELGTARLCVRHSAAGPRRPENCLRRRRESRDHAGQVRSARRGKSNERTDGGHGQSSDRERSALHRTRLSRATMGLRDPSRRALGRGGHTKITNLRLVCWYHHKRTHARADA